MTDIFDNLDFPFEFTDEGYAGPSFNRGTSMSNIRAAITGAELERDYLKSCDEYIVGYSQNALQILRSNCVYGGIRDLQASIAVLSHIRDLPAYIKQTYASQFDITKIVRGWGQDNLDLTETIKGWKTIHKDLPFYLKQGYSDDVDIPVYLKTFYAQQEDLRNIVRGWSTGNVVDIINTIRIWHEDTKDIPAYLKTTIQQDLDLPTIVYKIWQHQQEDLNKMLHGWQEAQLQKIIRAFNFLDLPVAVRSTYFDDLAGWLYAIQPVDIPADLHGWAIGDLSAHIAKGEYDGDLPTNIFGVAPKDLPVSIQVRLGLAVPKDLPVYLSGAYSEDLNLRLNIIQRFDLNAYLNSSLDFSDLTFKIYPRLIHVKHHINVSFLEHRDLAAIINFPCFSSAFRDLSSYIFVHHSKDLKFYIWGADYSNIVDLRCSINASDYLSADTINIKYFHDSQPMSITTLKYEHKQPIYSFNTINMWTNTFTRDATNLAAAITGDYITRDLPVYIRAYSNFHHRSPNVQETFVTLKLKNNQEDFRRYVELTFNSYADKYTYFSGNQRAYRNNRNDHWVIRVEGHELLPVGRGIEKRKVRRKYIFNLKNYESIDEAIRDMVDRVTNLKTSDLTAYIESTNDRVANLGAYVRTKRIFKSNRVLQGILKAGQTTLNNLPIILIPTLNKGQSNLTNNITAIEYVEPDAGIVDFEFIGSGDSVSDPDDADFIFDLGDDNDST